MSTRWENFAAAEKATADYLRDLGNEPLEFGAAQLSARARQLQRLDNDPTPDLMRWLADNLVKSVGSELVYVDAKFALHGRANYSLEMRSMLSARLQTRRVFYVCARMGLDGDFYGFRAIWSGDVPRAWPCCGRCQTIYLTGRDIQEINQRLPKYCPQQHKGDASGTPYFVVPFDDEGWGKPNPLGVPAPYERDECSHSHASCVFGFGLVCLNGDACRNPHHDRRPYKSQLLIGADDELHPSVRRQP
jgi:hypothetical protein